MVKLTTLNSGLNTPKVGQLRLEIRHDDMARLRQISCDGTESEMVSFATIIKYQVYSMVVLGFRFVEWWVTLYCNMYIIMRLIFGVLEGTIRLRSSSTKLTRWTKDNSSLHSWRCCCATTGPIYLTVGCDDAWLSLQSSGPVMTQFLWISSCCSISLSTYPVVVSEFWGWVVSLVFFNVSPLVVL